MSFLLDTCLLSEGMAGPIDVGVAAWLSSTNEGERFVSVLSLAEIRYGVVRLNAGSRRSQLFKWFEVSLLPFVGDRLLPVDLRAALAWAELRATNPAAPVIDCQIAATALVHNLTLVTRNVRDFAFPGLAVFNPWSK